MKKIIFTLLSLCMPILLFASCTFSSNSGQNKNVADNDKSNVDVKFTPVGTLTAYYAKVSFGDHKKGDLIVDTNDPINRIVNYSKTKYKYEGDDTGVYYSSLILKSNVTVKTYEMTPLPVSLVKNGATFVSNDGDVVRIFVAHANGHRFYSYDEDDYEYNLRYDAFQTTQHQEYYALSCKFKSLDSPGFSFFEEPLMVEGGNIKLYVNGADVHLCSFSDDPDDCRYRPYVMGFMEEEWDVPEEYGFQKSAYDARGNLLVDLHSFESLPSYLSIAYIGAEDALYIDGTLYYRQ